MKDSLVALNITSNDKLLNKNNVPILFYWNGESTLINAIYNDINFKSLLYNTVMNYDNYANAKLSFFYYEGENENYTEDFCFVQNDIKLFDLDDETRMFYKMYLWNHFKFLYESAFHEKYEGNVSLFEMDECILDIYDQIQSKYPKRVIKSTVINYIRSELQKTDCLSMENTDWIIEQLENLLNEREQRNGKKLKNTKQKNKDLEIYKNRKIYKIII